MNYTYNTSTWVTNAHVFYKNWIHCDFANMTLQQFQQRNWTFRAKLEIFIIKLNSKSLIHQNDKKIIIRNLIKELDFAIKHIYFNFYKNY